VRVKRANEIENELTRSKLVIGLDLFNVTQNQETRSSSTLAFDVSALNAVGLEEFIDRRRNFYDVRLQRKMSGI
jgi:hypothetical protein